MEAVRSRGIEANDQVVEYLRRTSSIRFILGQILLSAAAVVFSIYVLEHTIRHRDSPVWDLLFPSIGPIVVIWLTLRHGRNNSARWLSQTKDPRAVGPLLEAFPKLAYGKPEARDALLRLLPGMRAENGASLTALQRQRLFGFMRGDDRVLALAAVQAAGTLSTPDAIAPLERVLSGDWNPRLHEELRAAAERSLESVRIRIEEIRARDLLLRTSTDPGPAEPTLLLPAEGVAVTIDSERLVRPADGEDCQTDALTQSIPLSAAPPEGV